MCADGRLPWDWSRLDCFWPLTLGQTSGFLGVLVHLFQSVICWADRHALLCLAQPARVVWLAAGCAMAVPHHMLLDICFSTIEWA